MVSLLNCDAKQNQRQVEWTCTWTGFLALPVALLVVPLSLIIHVLHLHELLNWDQQHKLLELSSQTLTP